MKVETCEIQPWWSAVDVIGIGERISAELRERGWFVSLDDCVDELHRAGGIEGLAFETLIEELEERHAPWAVAA